MRGTGRAWTWVFWILALLFSAGEATAATNAPEVFDAAARSYEQGKYREAAAAYEKLAAEGVGTVSVWFNLGNAWLRAGEKGRAIASYRQARKLAPRDPDIATNLEHARSKVGAGRLPPSGWGDRFRELLTPNEWAAAALAGVWIWFTWMMARDWIPRWKDRGEGSGAFLAGIAATLLALAFWATALGQREVAVVIASEATVRYGPLEEAQTAFTLSDGAELRVTDRKGDWVEVRDGSGRRGWIATRHLARVP